MNAYQDYSPASPTPSQNEGLSNLELELENKKARIPILNQRYQTALVELEVADRNLQLAENKKRSFRTKRQREECNGCKRKWCNTCVFNNAAKRVRVIGLDIEFNESEIKVITQEVEVERQQRRAQSVAFQSVPPCPEPQFSDDDDEDDSITDNSDEVEPVKEEPDVKVEPEDDYVPNIGMVNAVKSEPMDSDAGIESDDDSEDDNDNDSDDDAENNDDINDSIETDEEVQDQYPDTPDNTDYSTETDAESDADSNAGSDAEADPIQRFRNILSKL